MCSFGSQKGMLNLGTLIVPDQPLLSKSPKRKQNSASSYDSLSGCPRDCSVEEKTRSVQTACHRGAVERAKRPRRCTLPCIVIRVEEAGQGKDNRGFEGSCSCNEPIGHNTDSALVVFGIGLPGPCIHQIAQFGAGIERGD